MLKLKKIKWILLLTFIVLSKHSWCDCTNFGLEAYPSKCNITSNSIFMIEGYGFGQEIIHSLNHKYPVYLLSSKSKVRLLVQEICVSRYDLTQAILKPETPLLFGEDYTLKIDSVSIYEGIYRYNSQTQNYEVVKYKVDLIKDTIAPLLLKKPKILKKTLTYYGCGPSTYVIFDFPVVDSSEVFVKTTLKSIQSGREHTYYIRMYSNKLYVGHDMCSGEFDFDEGESYEIEFSLMDASGNFSNWTGKRIKFTKPTKQTKDALE